MKNKPRTAKVGAISKAQNLKGGPFGLCETPAGCKKFKKIEGGTLCDFLTSIVLQNIETNEGGPSGAIQKTSKKVA